MATKNIQLKDGNGDLLMPKTDAKIVDYESESTLISATSLQDAADSVLSGNIQIDFTTPNGIGYLHPHSRKWVIDDLERRHYVIPSMNCGKVLVTASNDFNTLIYFLRSYTTPVNNDSADFTTCPQQLCLVEKGTSATLDVPYDCNYIVISGKNSYQLLIPSSVYLLDKKPIKSKGTYYDVALTNAYYSKNWISGTNGNTVVNTTSTHYVFAVDEMYSIAITAGINNCYYTFATDLSTETWTPLLGKRFEIEAGSTSEIVIPTGAKYIIIGKTSGAGGTNYAPTAIRVNYEAQTPVKSIDFASEETYFGWISKNGLVIHQEGSEFYAIPVKGDKVSINPSDNQSVVVFATEKFGYNWTIDIGMTRSVLSREEVLNVPLSAKYLIVGKKSSATGLDYTPKSVVFRSTIETTSKDFANIILPTSPYTMTPVRVMTYNIGHLNGGGASTTSSISDNNYIEVKDAFNTIFSQFTPFLTGLVEYTTLFAPNTTEHSTETTKEAILNEFWSYYEGERYTVGSKIDYNALMARLPIFDCEMKSWEDARLTRKYLSAKLNFLGIPVKIIVSHFQFNSSDKTDTTLQDLQVSEIISECANASHVIVMGDLNIPSLSVLDPFKAAGYSLSNGGDFGEFETYRKNDGFATKCLDNIIVKGFDIERVHMIDSDLSDHNPLLSDIRIKL